MKSTVTIVYESAICICFATVFHHCSGFFGIGSCAESSFPCGGFVFLGFAKREPDVTSRMRFCSIPLLLWSCLTSYRLPILLVVCPNLIAKSAFIEYSFDCE